MNEKIKEDVDIIELFPPPRVTHNMSKFKTLGKGFAFESRVTDPEGGMPWDLNMTGK